MMEETKFDFLPSRKWQAWETVVFWISPCRSVLSSQTVNGSPGHFVTFVQVRKNIVKRTMRQYCNFFKKIRYEKNPSVSLAKYCLRENRSSSCLTVCFLLFCKHLKAENVFCWESLSDFLLNRQFCNKEFSDVPFSANCCLQHFIPHCSKQNKIWQ